MAERRKYYYLKLKETYFDDAAVLLLESMPDGILYSNILLKLYLKSLKNDGRLCLAEGIPCDVTMLATITRQKERTIRAALELFQKLGLVERLPDGTLYMTNIELLIGQSSTEAERKQKARKLLKTIPEKTPENFSKKDPEKLQEGYITREAKKPENPPVSTEMSAGDFCQGVDICPPYSRDICPPEIEREKEIEKEIEIEPEPEKEKEREREDAAPALGRFENVFLSNWELEELQREAPDKWQYYIDRLSCHMASTGKRYRSHLATILKWVQEDGGGKSQGGYTYQEGESL